MYTCLTKTLSVPPALSTLVIMTNVRENRKKFVLLLLTMTLDEKRIHLTIFAFRLMGKTILGFVLKAYLAFWMPATVETRCSVFVRVFWPCRNVLFPQGTNNASRDVRKTYFLNRPHTKIGMITRAWWVLVSEHIRMFWECLSSLWKH